jgi:hypothetical protein
MAMSEQAVGDVLRFSIIKGNDNGCANISISLNLESMQVNLFDTIQTFRKIVYTSVFVTLTAFVDNILSFNLESQKWTMSCRYLIYHREPYWWGAPTKYFPLNPNNEQLDSIIVWSKVALFSPWA